MRGLKCDFVESGLQFLFRPCFEPGSTLLGGGSKVVVSCEAVVHSTLDPLCTRDR